MNLIEIKTIRSETDKKITHLKKNYKVKFEKKYPFQSSPCNQCNIKSSNLI